MSQFGDWIRGRREELGIGLREFAESIYTDPGNWSRFERGGVMPLISGKIIEVGLRIEEGTDEYHRFYRLLIYEGCDMSARKYLREHMSEWLE